MDTEDLTGIALDWAVSKANGVTWDAERFRTWHERGELQYSSDWSVGGPIIERERIGIDGMGLDNVNAGEVEAFKWVGGEHDAFPLTAVGPTPLIAAMRCYVASQLGDEVEIPEELTKV